MLSFFSTSPNWVSPTPSPGGGHTPLRERGWGRGHNSDEWTETVVLWVYIYVVLQSYQIGEGRRQSRKKETIRRSSKRVGDGIEVKEEGKG